MLSSLRICFLYFASLSAFAFSRCSGFLLNKPKAPKSVAAMIIPMSAKGVISCSMNDFAAPAKEFFCRNNKSAY